MKFPIRDAGPDDLPRQFFFLFVFLLMRQGFAMIHVPSDFAGEFSPRLHSYVPVQVINFSSKAGLEERMTFDRLFFGKLADSVELDGPLTPREKKTIFLSVIRLLVGGKNPPQRPLLWCPAPLPSKMPLFFLRLRFFFETE